MIYDHAVIKNGILYPTGTEVQGTKKEVLNEEKTIETEMTEPVKRGRPSKKEK